MEIVADFTDGSTPMPEDNSGEQLSERELPPGVVGSPESQPEPPEGAMKGPDSLGDESGVPLHPGAPGNDETPEEPKAAPTNPLLALEQMDFSGLGTAEEREELPPQEEDPQGLTEPKGEDGDPPAIKTYTAEEVDSLKEEWAKEYKPEAQTEKDDVFANDMMRKLNDIVKAGGKIDNKFWEYQDIDFDSADLSKPDVAIEVLKAHLTDIENYTEEDADFILEEKYGLLGRNLDPNAFEEDVLAYNKEARRAKIDAMGKVGGLKEFQQSLMLPKEDPNNKREPAPEVQQDPRVVEAYVKGANEYLDNYDGFEYELTNDVKLNFTPTEEEMGNLRKVITEVEEHGNFFNNRYATKEGVDFDRFANEMHILDNLDSIFNEAFHQMSAIAREQMAKEDGISPTLRKGRTPSDGNEIPSMAQQILKNAKY